MNFTNHWPELQKKVYLEGERLRKFQQSGLKLKQINSNI